MKYLGILLVFFTTFFIGCGGGGGDTSSAGTSNIVKANGSAGTNGANYMIRDSLNISWKHPIADSKIVLSDFVLIIDGEKYSSNYTVEKSLYINSLTGFVEPGSTTVFYAYIATLPYSKKSRVGTLNITYSIGKESRRVAVPIELLPFENPDKNTITSIDASTESTFDSQELHYTGKIKSGDEPQANALVSYSIQTPSYIQGSTSKGTLTTDESGTFTLKLNSAINDSEEERNIVVLLNYKDVSEVWNVKQAGYPEFSFQKISADTSVVAAGGNVTYVGKVANAANQTIECTVTQSDIASITNSPVKTDTYGNFTVKLKVNAYTDINASARSINVAMKYKNANTTWSLTQAAPTN